MGFRSNMYTLLRWLNHLNAGKQAIKQGSPMPIVKRVGRVLFGREATKLRERLFR